MSGQKLGPPPDGVTEVEIDGRISVYAPGEQQVLLLNDTASDVWRLLDGENDLEQITALLATAYGVDPGTIAEDVRAAVQNFVDAGALAPVDE